MKRIILLSACTLIMMHSASAQDIPNQNFENWTQGANSSPDGWSGRNSNTVGFYPVSQSNDSYSGSYSMKLENKIAGADTTKGSASTTRPGGIEGLGSAFAVSFNHTSLKGYYKYAPQQGDSAQILVAMFKDGYSNTQGFGNLIKFGSVNLPAAATWTPFSTPAFFEDGSGNPDSAYIDISAFKQIDLTTGTELPVLGNSVLYIDLLNFDSFLTGVEVKNSIASSISVFPSPVSENSTIVFETMEEDYTSVAVFDMSGKLVKQLYKGTLASGKHIMKFDNLSMNEGNYFILVSSPKGFSSEKIVVAKQ